MPAPIAPTTLPSEVEGIRKRIDEIDNGLVDLLAARVALAREAITLKAAHGAPPEDLEREAAVVRRAASLARIRGIEPEMVRNVFWRVVALSRSPNGAHAGEATE